MRLGPWICAALVAFGDLSLVPHARTSSMRPACIAADEPAQREIDSATSSKGLVSGCVPRAEFRATVRVLHREDYSLGPLAQLVPTDFAVGWGPMSDSARARGHRDQPGQPLLLLAHGHWPIERRDIETHSANWHVIPENAVGARRAGAGARRQRGRAAGPAGGHRRQGGRHAHLARPATTPAPAPAKSCWPIPRCVATLKPEGADDRTV